MSGHDKFLEYMKFLLNDYNQAIHQFKAAYG